MAAITQLADLGSDLLREASGTTAGRAARTIHGGHEHALRQTVIAVLHGHRLCRHESPPEATLQVLRGAVRLTMSDSDIELGEGEYLVIPPAAHGLEPIRDAVVLLTVSLRG